MMQLETVDPVTGEIAGEEPAQVPAVRQPASMAFSPRNLPEAIEFAKLIASSDLVPKDYHGKPANVVVAIQWGYELGLHPMQALQNIAVINGRPSIYGDAAIALVRASRLCEFVHEHIEGEGEAMAAVCTAKRRGQAEQSVTFSVADAKRALLWGKQGPWQQYPRRMLQMRARGFCLRDLFPDVLRGLVTLEEARESAVVDGVYSMPGGDSAHEQAAQITDPAPGAQDTPGAGKACMHCSMPVTAEEAAVCERKKARYQHRECAQRARAAKNGNGQAAALESADQQPETAAAGALFPPAQAEPEYEPGAEG